MLGHKMSQRLEARGFETWCALRGAADAQWWTSVPDVPRSRVLENVDALDGDALDAAMETAQPEVVINCAGLVKQRKSAASPISTITVNALLPHRLIETCGKRDSRLIHFSTDCVFSGERGSYTEDDPTDATDLYGRTKALGEVGGRHALTIRTSIIGRELHNHAGLLDWFLVQNGRRVQGFKNVWWSGVTTNHLSDTVAWLLEEHRALRGVYQLSSGRISKYELLRLLANAFRLQVEIDGADDPHCDRSLLGTRFERDTKYVFPGWDFVLDDLARDPTPYPQPGLHEGS